MSFVFKLFYHPALFSLRRCAERRSSRRTLLPETSTVASAVGTAHDVDSYDHRERRVLTLVFPSPTNRTETAVAAFFEQAVLHRHSAENTIDCETHRCEACLTGSPPSYPTSIALATLGLRKKVVCMSMHTSYETQTLHQEAVCPSLIFLVEL